MAGTQTPDIQALLLYGLACRDMKGGRPSRLEAKALVNLIRAQDRLGSVALSCLTLCAAQYGFEDEAAGLAAQLRARAVRGRDCYGQDSAYWKGSDIPGTVPADEVENTAMAVLALEAVGGPHGELVVEGLRTIFSRAVEARWDGPRETALCLFALRDYSAGSLETDLAAVSVAKKNGEPVARYDSAAEKLPLPPPAARVDFCRDSSAVSLARTSGASPVFATLSADAVPPGDISGEICPDTPPALTEENPAEIPAASNIDGVVVSRTFLRVVQVPTLLRGFDEKIVEVGHGGVFKTGERIEEVIVIDTGRTIPEAVIEEDMPGFVSWHPSAPGEDSLLCRDNPALRPGHTASFSAPGVFRLALENLPPGRWEIRIPMRVDYEGAFVVPPARLRVPEKSSLAASSETLRVRCEGAAPETGAADASQPSK